MSQPILGIDVAKTSLVVCLLLSKRTLRKEFANTPSGISALLAWLADHTPTPVHACLEATGIYGDDVALALYQAGHTLSVINPARIADYAKSLGAPNKTDPVDAALIARYCQKEQPPAWKPPPQEVRDLRTLVRHLHGLQQMRRQEANRLSEGAPNQVLRTALSAHLAFLTEQIAHFEQLINDQIERHAELKRQHDLIASIKGLGGRTAALVLAEIGDVRQFASARQLAAYAGLNPREYRSGSSVRKHTRLSKIGNAALRRALYMPALSAVQHNPVIRALRERLLARGKSKMAVIGAAMRKLLHLVYGVVKSGKPFDSHYGLSLTTR